MFHFMTVFLLLLFIVLAFRQTYKDMRYDRSHIVLADALRKNTQPSDKILIVQDVPDPGAFIYSHRGGWLQTIWDFDAKKVPDFINVIALRLSKDKFLEFRYKFDAYHVGDPSPTPHVATTQDDIGLWPMSLRAPKGRRSLLVHARNDREMTEIPATAGMTWSYQAPLGRQEKCGMFEFFFGKCKRTEYVLMIIQK